MPATHTARRSIAMTPHMRLRLRDEPELPRDIPTDSDNLDLRFPR